MILGLVAPSPGGVRVESFDLGHRRGRVVVQFASRSIHPSATRLRRSSCRRSLRAPKSTSILVAIEVAFAAASEGQSTGSSQASTHWAPGSVSSEFPREPVAPVEWQVALDSPRLRENQTGVHSAAGDQAELSYQDDPASRHRDDSRVTASPTHPPAQCRK